MPDSILKAFLQVKCPEEVPNYLNLKLIIISDTGSEKLDLNDIEDGRADDLAYFNRL